MSVFARFSPNLQEAIVALSGAPLVADDDNAALVPQEDVW